MGDFLLDFITDQHEKSGIQKWAADQAQQGNLDQSTADIAKSAPGFFRDQILPGIMQRQQQGSALATVYGQQQQQQPSIPQGMPLDADTYLPQQLAGPPAPPPVDNSKITAISGLPPAAQQLALQNLQLGGFGENGNNGLLDSSYIKAVANYKKAPPPATISQRNPILAMAVNNAILSQNPDYDDKKYAAMKASEKDMNPGGRVGDKLVQAGTAINHLADAQTASDQMGGVDLGFASPMINAGINAYNSQSPALQNYQRFSKQGADEVAAFTGSNTIPGMASQEALLSQNKAPSARTSAIQAAVQTMFDKLQPEVDAYNRVQGTNKTPADFMSPQTKQSLVRLGILSTDQGAQPATGATAASGSSSLPTPEQAKAILAARRAGK